MINRKHIHQSIPWQLSSIFSCSLCRKATTQNNIINIQWSFPLNMDCNSIKTIQTIPYTLSNTKNNNNTINKKKITVNHRGLSRINKLTTQLSVQGPNWCSTCWGHSLSLTLIHPSRIQMSPCTPCLFPTNTIPVIRCYPVVMLPPCNSKPQPSLSFCPAVFPQMSA